MGTEATPLRHYVIVRADLPRGYQSAQIVHAAGESSGGNLPAGTYAVVLSVPDEDALWDVHSDLIQHSDSADPNGDHVVIHDPDPPRNWPKPWGTPRPGLKRGGAGEATAIGVRPSRDRAKLARALGRLPLLK